MAIEDLTPTELAYIAGIIDGEGHLGARLHRSNKSPYAIDISVRVGMTHLETIEWLQDHCGGRFHTKPITGVRTKVFHEWKLSRPLGAPLLRRLMPYLITKRGEAEIWLEISDLIGSKRRKPLPAVHEKRIALVTDLIELRRAS